MRISGIQYGMGCGAEMRLCEPLRAIQGQEQNDTGYSDVHFVYWTCLFANTNVSFLYQIAVLCRCMDWII